MAKKITLPTEFGQFRSLIAISSPLKDYRLVHTLNQSLHISMKRLDDFPFFRNDEVGFEYYPFFYFEDEFYRLNYFLFANKTEGSILFTELKNIDYVLLFEGVLTKEQENDIVSQIKKLNNIVLVLPVMLTAIKNIDLIFSDLEYHMTDLNKKNK